MKSLLAFAAAFAKVVDWIEKAAKAYKTAKVDKRSKEFHDHAEEVEHAQTDEDRRKLARAASDLMRGSKPDGSQD